MDPSFADRYLNEGFSGGEKKRNEILQMAILEPELAILDETDSGLDIDALRVVAKGVQEVRADRPELGVLAITHYQRLLDHLQPDGCTSSSTGRIVDTGGPELAAAARGRGLRRMAIESAATTASTSPPSRRTSRILDRDGPRQADSSTSTRRRRRRSPRSCSTRWTDYYETTHANVHRGVYAIAEEATDALRGGPGQGRPLHRRARPTARVVFTKNATEALNLVAQSWGRANLRRRRRRRCSPRWSTTPTSSRGSCSAEERGIELRWIPLDRRRPARPHRPRPPARRRRSCVGVTAMSNVLGTLTPVRRLADAAHAAGALVLVDAAQYVPHLATDVADLGADFLAFTGHKMLRPHRHRRAVGPRGAARGHAAVPRRRRDDPRRPPRRLHAQRAPVEVRGRHPADRRGHRPRRRRRLPRRRSAWTPCARTRSRSPPTPCAPSPSASATTSPSTARRARRARRRAVLRLRATSTPTTSPRCSTSTACACGPATTAPSRSCGVLGVGATARASFYVYNDDADVDALADALGRRRRVLRLLTTRRVTDARPRRPLPRDHPRPLPQPPEPGRAASRRRPTGSRASTRCAATRSSSTSTSTTTARSPTSASAARAARSASRRRR